MVDPVSPIGSVLQATLTGDLLKTLETALASGSITSAPSSIQNTQTPIAISGTLVSQLQGGGAVVQTAAGPVTLALNNNPPPLPAGTLTLLIQPGNPPTASVINQQAVTPQAQIQTQATAAQQTQDVQTQPLQALPPITVGQVLSATPLPPAATAAAVQTAPALETQPVPVISQAASRAAIASAIEVELPIAVLLNSAVPPAPTAPTATFVTRNPFVVDAVEPSPEEEAVSLSGQQPQTQSTSQSAQNSSPEIDTDFDDAEITGPSNFLAAQESLNDTQPPPNAPLPTATPTPLAYTPGVTVSAQQLAQSQNFLVLNVAAPSADGSAPQAFATGGQTLTVTVAAQTSTGQPLLTTPDGGALLVSQKVSSPVGTELTLQRLTPEQAATQSQQSAPQTSAPAPLSQVPLSIARQQPWPALTQLLTTLGAASPTAASYIRQAIPTTGPSLNDGFAQAFTAFLTRGAATTGSVPAPGALVVPISLLPGQGVAARTADPQQLRATLLQVAGDLSSTMPKAAAAQPWQGHQVPVLTDYGITMAQLFVRRQAEPVDDETGTRPALSSTRFLVEISPSQLGPVQLDGLLRKTQTKMDRLDLIVRTEFAVPPQAAEEMANLFQGALGATGVAGALSFQTGPENFVLPASEDTTPYRDGGERSI